MLQLSFDLYKLDFSRSFSLNFISNSVFFFVFQPKVLDDEVAKHLTGAQDMLQKHKLLESDIAAQANRIKNVNAQAQKYADMAPEDGTDGREG